MLDPIENAKTELYQKRLELQNERICDDVQELIEEAIRLEAEAGLFSRQSQEVSTQQKRRTDDAHSITDKHMKQRIKHTIDMRQRLESEMKETKRIIRQAALDLERKRNTLKAYYAKPVRSLQSAPDEGEIETKRYDSWGPRVEAQLNELRVKIKGSCYTGSQGRQLDVLFERFDRDGSGTLEEHELRNAFRRTLRVPPSLVTDAEITCLCNILDADGSGNVSIQEILDFLDANTDVKDIEERCAKIQELMDRLKQEQKRSLMDMRCKTAAWKIDEACSKLTVAKAIDWGPDVLQSPRKVCGGSLNSTGNSGLPPPRPAPASPSKPKKKDQISFEKGQLDSLRSKIKAAAYTGKNGRQLDVIFARYSEF
jgi:hypothetical protein